MPRRLTQPIHPDILQRQTLAMSTHPRCHEWIYDYGRRPASVREADGEQNRHAEAGPTRVGPVTCLPGRSPADHRPRSSH